MASLPVLTCNRVFGQALGLDAPSPVDGGRPCRQAGAACTHYTATSTGLVCGAQCLSTFFCTFCCNEQEPSSAKDERSRDPWTHFLLTVVSARPRDATANTVGMLVVGMLVVAGEGTRRALPRCTSGDGKQ